MKSQINRRNFVNKSSVACCTLLLSTRLSAFNSIVYFQEETPNPKKLNYCGYKCPDNCQFLVASVKNDHELKKQAYETWKINERYNIEFDAEKIFCFGCKNDKKPAGVVTQNCTVRECAINKKLDCCIECNELKTCNKDLWINFPDFYNTVKKMQEAHKKANS